jgi:transcriptional regulator with XRE-family HTH domain
MLTTGYQLKAARALLGLEQTQVAAMVGVSVNTIRNMEASAAFEIAGRSANVRAVQRALEAAGAEFLNHGNPGVRVRLDGRTIVDVRSVDDELAVPLEINSFVRIPSGDEDLRRHLEGRGFLAIKSDGQHHLMRRDFSDGAIATERR